MLWEDTPRPKILDESTAHGRSFTEGSCSGRVRDIQLGYRAPPVAISIAPQLKKKAALAIGLGCLLSSAVTSGVSAASAPASGSASHTLNTAVAAATKKGSVRVTVHFFSGKTTGELVQDSARQSAVQTVAIGKERVSIVLLDGTAYFSGNVKGLTSYFGMPKTVAATLPGRWISVSPTDSGFPSVTAGLSLGAALKEATPVGLIKMGKQKKLAGQLTQSISGTGSTDVPPTTLFISTTGSHLPVEAVASRGTGKGLSGEIATFSRWGEKVSVPTPTNAIPISTLSAPAPAGG
jgi:hypothetical protein